MDRRSFLASGMLAPLFRKKKKMVWSVQEDSTFILQPGEPFLVYNGIPAAQSLILAISAVAGQDSFENKYSEGLTLEGAGNNPALWPRVDFRRNSDGHVIGSIIGTDQGANSTLIIEGGDNTLPGQVQIVASNFPSAALGFFVVSEFGYQFGVNDDPGATYYEEVFLPGTLIANNTLTTLTGLTAGTQRSDYGRAWNLGTGTWTCPVTGRYLIEFSHAYTNWVANSRQTAIILRNGVGVGGSDANNGHGASALSPVSCSTYRNLQQGDTVQVQVLQNTGVAQNLRVFDGSYVSIGRIR